MIESAGLTVMKLLCSRKRSERKGISFELIQLGTRKKIMKLIKKFLRNEEGATAIEYGLIAALISVAIITATTSVGTGVSTTFKAVAGNLTKAK
jgi:pilus assembly protein Flp/PilA